MAISRPALRSQLLTSTVYNRTSSVTLKWTDWIRFQQKIKRNIPPSKGSTWFPEDAGVSSYLIRVLRLHYNFDTQSITYFQTKVKKRTNSESDHDFQLQLSTRNKTKFKRAHEIRFNFHNFTVIILCTNCSQILYSVHKLPLTFFSLVYFHQQIILCWFTYCRSLYMVRHLTIFFNCNT